MIRRILILLSFYLFSSGYSIASMWLPKGLDKAWDVRMLVISIYTLVLFLALSIEESEKYKKFNRFLLFVIAWIVTEDVIHKIIGINEFGWMDIVYVVMSVITFYIIYYTSLPKKFINFLCQKLKL